MYEIQLKNTHNLHKEYLLFTFDFFQNMTTITNHQSPVLKMFDIGTYNCRSLQYL